MRKTNVKFLTCVAMTLIALGALITPAQAQTVTPLIGFTEQSWQYYQNGDQPANIGGVDWKSTNYNDTAWNTGFGFFAYEPDTPQNYNPINTTLAYQVSPFINAYYFRTHFTFTGSLSNVFLVFTNIVDDGCVVYLNGTELYRLHMPTGPVDYNTASAGGPAVEGTNEVVTLFNSPGLRQGDNVFAVEVHQVNNTSSDAAWNVGVAYYRPDSIVITKQPPAKIAAVQFDDFSISVEVSGTQPRFWWFKDNAFLTGQTNASLSFLNISNTQAGTYWVVVSNAVSGVRSSNTVITVVPDTFGPTLLDAYVPVGETNRLLLQFDEDINRFVASNLISGQNTNNYFVTILNQPTNRLRATLAQVGAGSAQVRLTFETNFNFATNYQICISNITDVRTNFIAWNTCVPIGFQVATNPVPYQSPWTYVSLGQCQDGTNWTDLNFQEDPFVWFDGRGLFSYTTPASSCGSSYNSPLSQGPTTFYFRTKFIMPTNRVGIPLDVTIGHIVDDGVIFYLNGKELGRYNMPAGPAFCSTKATGAVNDDCRTITVNDVVFARTNLLAAELHENGSSATDFDVVFDASLSTTFITYPKFTQQTNVFIRVTNFSSTNISVYFTNGFGYAIQSKTNLTEPWREVQPVTNRLIVPKANPRQFYRLQKHQ